MIRSSRNGCRRFGRARPAQSKQDRGAGVGYRQAGQPGADDFQPVRAHCRIIGDRAGHMPIDLSPLEADCAEQQRARQRSPKEWRDAKQVHAVGDEPERDRAERGAGHAANSAGELHAAEGDRGDRD